MTFCTCPDPVLPATRALTWEDHPGCDWPAKPCDDAAHGQIVHEECGRVVEMAFCTCERGASAGFATTKSVTGGSTSSAAGRPKRGSPPMAGEPRCACAA